MIINAGIQRIVYEVGYADALAKEMLRESGIEAEKFNRSKKVKGKKSKVIGTESL
jgi:deoxycytidylate deaminase